MTTGERIKTARKEAGLTQKELGARLGISPQTVAQWENNLRNPKRETLRRIANALGLNVEDLDGYKSLDMNEVMLNALRAVSGRDSEIETILNKLDQDKTTLGDKGFAGYFKRDNTEHLNKLFLKLNARGQKVALERVEELTEIPKYQKSPPQAAAQDGENETEGG